MSRIENAGASHGWDMAGTKGTGMKPAFILKPGQQLYPMLKNQI